MDTDLTPVMDPDDCRRAQALSVQPRRPPADVPGYLPTCFLGTGAYGEVWQARHRNTGVLVAIKFFNHRGGLDWSLLCREVEKLRFLSAGTHVVRLLQVGWDADPPYYIMDYLENGSLEDVLANGPLPVAEAVSLFRAVADGLRHAHARGILHCDLKPANILLDQDARPRLADFGQSRLTNELAPSLGTLYYMAPEQADLKAVPDARWDVYALGAVLYHMLTGQQPYRPDAGRGKPTPGQSLTERLAQYRTLIAQAPPLSAHRKIRGVDRALADIIDRCLERDPRRRFANVEAVLQALDRRELQRARRPLVALGIIAPLLLLAVGGAVAWSSFTEAVQSSNSLLRQQALRNNRTLARSIAKEIGRRIEVYWLILQREAHGRGLQEVIQKAQEKRWRELELLPRTELQDELKGMQQRYRDSVPARFWFVDDRLGYELGVVPPEGAARQTVGRRYAYRAYFHGGEKDLPRGEAAPPLKNPQMTRVFKSDGGPLTVAFSVPVWSANEDRKSIIGVLAMSIEVGKLGATTQCNERGQTWILVDQDTGDILHHSDLDLEQQAREKPQWGELLDPDSDQFRGEKQALKKALDELPAAPAERSWVYPERLQQAFPESFEREWVLFASAVEADFPDKGDPDGAKQPPRKPHWTVLVQQRRADVVRPVDQLRKDLMWRGVLGAVVAALALSAVWAFVLLGLSDSPRSPFTRLLRRRLGLATPSPSTPRTPLSPAPAGEPTAPQVVPSRGDPTQVSRGAAKTSPQPSRPSADAGAEAAHPASQPQSPHGG